MVQIRFFLYLAESNNLRDIISTISSKKGADKSSEEIDQGEENVEEFEDEISDKSKLPDVLRELITRLQEEVMPELETRTSKEFRTKQKPQFVERTSTRS